jgi:hypothetical protein
MGNRSAAGRAPAGLRPALRLLPHPLHPLLGLRVAPVPLATAMRCTAMSLGPMTRMLAAASMALFKVVVMSRMTVA